MTLRDCKDCRLFLFYSILFFWRRFGISLVSKRRAYPATPPPTLIASLTANFIRRSAVSGRTRQVSAFQSGLIVCCFYLCAFHVVIRPPHFRDVVRFRGHQIVCVTKPLLCPCPLLTSIYNSRMSRAPMFFINYKIARSALLYLLLLKTNFRSASHVSRMTSRACFLACKTRCCSNHVSRPNSSYVELKPP